MSSPDACHATTTCRRRCRRCGGCASSATGTSRGLMVVAFALALLAALPDALLALWLKLLGDGVIDRRPRAACALAAVGLGALGGGDLVPAHGVAPGCSAASATGSPSPSSPTWPGCRRRSPRSPTRSGPSYLDRLSVLRDQVFVLDHMYMSVFSTRRVDPAPRRHRRAARVDPPGARCCSRCSPLPTVLTSTLAARRSSARRRSGAPPSKRLARHLFTTATTAPPGKEVRVTGIGPRLVAAAAGGVGALVRPGGRGPLGLGRCGTRLAWAVFGAAYVGGVVFVAVGPRRARRRRAARAGRRARACRPTSAPPSARSASCAASGWTARSGWPGSRTTPPPLDAAADVAGARPADRRASASTRVVRLPGHRPARARRRRRSRCRPARWWPSSARTAPARPRW